MEDFKDQGLLEQFNLSEREYSDSKVFVDVQYFGWHEDNSVGEVTLRIYEESQGIDTLTAKGVERRAVEELLEDKDMVEDQIDNELASTYENNDPTNVEAMD